MPFQSNNSLLTQNNRHPSTFPPLSAAEKPTQKFGGGSGTVEDPYIISEVKHLEELDTDVRGGTLYLDTYFRQTNNINMTGIEWAGIGEIQADMTKNMNPFRGNYDGGNFAIQNLTLKAQKYTGFFNSVNGATIKNLTINVLGYGTGTASGGILAGYATASRFENILTSGSLTTNENLGGIVGVCQWGGDVYFVNCTNEASLTTTAAKKLGGMCYQVQTARAYFIGCVNNGNITGTGDAYGFCGFGGNISFENCSNLGTVDGKGQFGPSAQYVAGDSNTAMADGLVMGAATDGANFAKTADIVDNVATLISNAQVVVGGEYLVMSKIGTLPITLNAVDQTIAFDNALYPTFAATITADGVAVTTNTVGTVTTYTAIKAAGEDWPTDPTVDEGKDAKATFPNLPADFEGADAGLVAAWAKGKGNLAYADMATASIDAFLLDCAAAEVATEAAKFKIISIENIGGEWVVKVTGEKTEGQNYTVNAKVDIIDVTTTLDADATKATDAKGFFKATLVPDFTPVN